MAGNPYRGGYGATPLATRGHLVQNAPAPLPPAIAHALNPLGSASLLPGMDGEQTRSAFDAQRFVEAGGNLTSQILHPTIQPFEQLYRRLPEEGMYALDVSPTKPFTFELGAFTVPDKMAVLLFDIKPNIYRFSGVDPGDYVPIETERFGSLMGFDLTVDQKRTGEVAFQLDPVAIQRQALQAFQDNNPIFPAANSGDFVIGQANTFAASTGAGTALMPQRPERYGALNIPFTIIAQSKQIVQASCVVFRPIPSPIAFVQYDIAGILVPQNWLSVILESVKAPQRAGLESNR